MATIIELYSNGQVIGQTPLRGVVSATRRLARELRRPVWYIKKNMIFMTDPDGIHGPVPPWDVAMWEAFWSPTED